MLDRDYEGRSPCPSEGVLDSQSIKAPQAKHRGYDAARKTTGRKCHVAVATGGRLLMINLTAGDVADSTGALPMLDALKNRWPGVNHFSADGAYDLAASMDKAQMLDFILQVARCHKDQTGLSSAAQALVRAAHVQLDDPPASLGAQLRTATRRLGGHDPHRRGQPHAAPTMRVKRFQTGSDYLCTTISDAVCKHRSDCITRFIASPVHHPQTALGRS